MIDRLLQFSTQPICSEYSGAAHFVFPWEPHNAYHRYTHRLLPQLTMPMLMLMLMVQLE